MDKNQFLLLGRCAVSALISIAATSYAIDLEQKCVPEEKKSPPWLIALDITQAKEYTTQPWYADWLLTTTTLCTDLTRLQKDNEKQLKGSKTIIWRNDSPEFAGILFRGMGSNHYLPDAIFKDGMPPRKADADANLMLRPGIASGALTDESGVASFTYSFDWAQRYGRQEDVHYVYLTLASGGISVDATLADDIKAVRTGEAEIAFPGGLLGKYIIGAFEADYSADRQRYGYGEIKKFLPNPNAVIKWVSPQPGKFNLMTVSAFPENHLDVYPSGDAVAGLIGVSQHDGGSGSKPILLSTTKPVAGTAPRVAWNVNGWRLGNFTSTCTLVSSELSVDGVVVVSADRPEIEEARKNGLHSCVSFVSQPAATDFKIVSEERNDNVLTVHYAWQPPSDKSKMIGYRIYLDMGNGAMLLKQIDDPTASSVVFTEDDFKLYGASSLYFNSVVITTVKQTDSEDLTGLMDGNIESVPEYVKF